MKVDLWHYTTTLERGERLVAGICANRTRDTGRIADLQLADKVEIESRRRCVAAFEETASSDVSVLHPARWAQGLRAPVLVCVCLDRPAWVATFVIRAGDRGVGVEEVHPTGWGRWAAWRDAWHVITEAVEEAV